MALLNPHPHPHQQKPHADVSRHAGSNSVSKARYPARRSAGAASRGEVEAAMLRVASLDHRCFARRADFPAIMSKPVKQRMTTVACVASNEAEAEQIGLDFPRENELCTTRLAKLVHKRQSEHSMIHYHIRGAAEAVQQP